MKKGILFVMLVVGGVLTVWAQEKSPKLTKEESAKLTQEQRVVHETDRRTKHGKKDLNLKKKIKVAKKQDRKAGKINQPNHRKSKKKPK